MCIRDSPITVSTTFVPVDLIPTLTSVTFSGMGATPNASYQLLCLCPETSLLAEGQIPASGVVSIEGLEDAAAGQTSFVIRIGDTFYGRFGVNVTNLSLAGQDTPIDCVPEPTTMLLLGTGLAGVAIERRKKVKRRGGQGK